MVVNLCHLLKESVDQQFMVQQFNNKTHHNNAHHRNVKKRCATTVACATMRDAKNCDITGHDNEKGHMEQLTVDTLHNNMAV